MGWGSSIRRGGGRKVRALSRKFVCPPSAREQSTKKMPNRPGFTHVQGVNHV